MKKLPNLQMRLTRVINKGILEIIREKKILSEQQIQELLDPVKLTNLNKAKYQKIENAQTPH